MSTLSGIRALSRELHNAWLRAEAAAAPEDSHEELREIARKLGDAMEILHHYEERLYGSLHQEEL